MTSDVIHNDSNWESRTENPIVVVRISFLLAATIWIAHYWDAASFGFYEDDYNFIGQTITSSGLENWYRVKYHLVNFWQGRPIFISVITLLSFWSVKLGGLPLLYGIGYAIVTANAILFYTLLRRLSADTVFCISGALAFALYPADTTHAFLTHTLGLRPALLFLLLACHCYMSGRRPASYVLILCSLLTYETPFTVFFAAPLLLDENGSARIQRLLKHGLILTIILACNIVLRQFMGESRLMNLDFITAIGTPFYQMLIGPIICLKMFIYRPIQALMSLDSGLMIFYLLCFAALFSLFTAIKDNATGIGPLKADDDEQNLSASWINDIKKPFAEVGLVGLLMLVLAYPLMFIVPADSIAGRDSRVHLAAMPGASILCGCACSALLSLGRRYGLQRLATTLLTTFFVLLVGFGISVQRDYTQAWLYQQVFWKEVIRLCPDLDEGTVILVEPDSLPQRAQIKSFSWSAPYVVEQIYDFPDNWEINPRLYWLQDGWQKHIASSKKFKLDNSVVTFYFWWEPERLLNSSNVIILEIDDGRMRRRTQSPELNGRYYKLKGFSLSGIVPRKKGTLYNYLIAPRESRVVVR